MREALQSTPNTVRLNPMQRSYGHTTKTFLQNPMLFVFDDAGFASSECLKSTQAFVMVTGSASGKENYVNGNGWLTWSNSTKIMRASRSSLSCEAVAISNAVGHTSWYQMYIRELITGCFFRDVPSAKDNLPPLNPFLFGRDETNLSQRQKIAKRKQRIKSRRILRA